MKKLITILLILTLLFLLSPITPIQAATRSVERQVTKGVDDCEVGAGTHWSLSGVGSSVGYYSPTYYALETGMRFQSIALPQGTTITTAYLIFTCQTSTSGVTVNSIIRGERTNDAAEFYDLANYKKRTRTTTKVTWSNINTWTKDIEYRSPEIKTVIQEIISRSGWNPGNDIVIFWGDTANSSSKANGCYRAQYTYEGSPTKSAKLHIEYEYAETLSEELVKELSGQVNDLSTRVNNLSSQVTKLSNSTTELQSLTSGLSSNLASLREDLTTIGSNLGDMKTNLEGKLNTIESQIGAFEVYIQALGTGQEVPQRLLVIEESLTKLEKKSTITFLDWISLVILIILGIAILSFIRRVRGRME